MDPKAAPGIWQGNAAGSGISVWFGDMQLLTAALPCAGCCSCSARGAGTAHCQATRVIAHPRRCWSACQLHAKVAGKVVAIELQQVVLVPFVVMSHLLYQVLHLRTRQSGFAHVYTFSICCTASRAHAVRVMRCSCLPWPNTRQTVCNRT